MVRFEGVLHKVSSSHTNIMVTRFAQSNRHMTLTVTYVLQERPDYRLVLYFPAVNEPRDPPPEWLMGHTDEHPKTGILGCVPKVVEKRPPHLIEPHSSKNTALIHFKTT